MVITVFFIPEFSFIILIISKKSFLTVGSPPVSLIFDTPNSDSALANLPISSILEKFYYHFLSILYPSGKQYPHLKLQTSEIESRMYGNFLPKLSLRIFI